MSRCTRPLYALDLGVKENGSRNIKILPRRADLYSQKQLEARYGKGNVIALPCGSCLACRVNKSKEWAVRCVLEGLYYDENYFLTLTYDDDNLPSDLLLHRKDLQDFLKRLRHYCKIRYFGCGEYGTKNNRPHYHLILFGLHLDDLKPVGAGLYESETIKKCWPFGFHYLGSMSYASCAYVAGYATKKFFKSIDKEHSEWICFSSHPGIGAQWFKDHYNTSLEYDCVIGPLGSSKVAPIPRYFDKMAELLDNARYVEMKAHRIDKSYAAVLNEMLIHGCENIEELLEYKENAEVNEYVAGRKGQRM